METCWEARIALYVVMQLLEVGYDILAILVYYMLISIPDTTNKPSI